MRRRWKFVGGASLAGFVTAGLIVIGRTGVVQGDVSDVNESTSTTTTARAAGSVEVPDDPTAPYPLGPGAIRYEDLRDAEKAAVDSIQETVETSQPPASYSAWAAATAWTGQRAEVEIAARSVGLVGTENDGVVP